MTTTEQYAYAERNTDEYRAGENQSEVSESPEKLFRHTDISPQGKENFNQENRVYSMQQEVRAVKNFDTSPAGKSGGLQLRDSNVALKERPNFGEKPLSLVESQGLAYSQTFGSNMSQSNLNVQPMSNSGLQRSSTFGRTSQIFQLHRNNIVISVTDPTRKGESFKGKQTFYSLQGSDSEGEFRVIRSHDDFIKIRTLLVKRWPGCYIPSVPPKRVLTKMVPLFLEGRRKEFEMFVQKITEIPHLHYSREYQRFLRSQNLEHELATFQEVNYNDIILKYNTVFKQQLQQGSTVVADRKIEEFRTFLRGVQSKFLVFKKVLKKTSAARKSYYEQLVSLHDIMSGGYEKDVLSRLDNGANSKRVFYNPEMTELNDKVFGVKQASKQDSIEYLHAWVKAENREISACLEAIEQKDIYNNKEKKASGNWVSSVDKLQRTIAGKPGFMAVFSGKSRDEQISVLQGKIAMQDKEAKQLKQLCEMIVLILANSEIDRFKERKSEQYHHVVHLAAQYELDNLRNLMEYWNTIVNIDSANAISQDNIPS